MSRRKQQNPKPLKYEPFGNPSLPGLKEEYDQASEKSPNSPTSSNMKPYSNNDNLNGNDVSVKNEPNSPESQSTQSEADGPPNQTSLESLLGIPEDAPLRVECTEDGKYKILTSKTITKGAGLDPLKAVRVDEPDLNSLTDSNSHFVSFVHSDGRVYFMLDNSINCGWLKYLGVPEEGRDANLRIYYVGGQLWVEVIKNLSKDEQLIAEFQPSSKEVKTSAEELDSVPDKSQTGPSNTNQANPKKTDSQFPCTLCGISFRNPNTLIAHRKHYCSKLCTMAPSSTPLVDKAANHVSPAVSSSTSDQNDPENQHTAYMCQVCKFVTITKADIESHIKEKHNSDASKSLGNALSGAHVNTEKTFCEDCEIHFKKPESYQAHKIHYCKKRIEAKSPNRSEAESSQISPPSTHSPTTTTFKNLYKKVSILDNPVLLTSPIASQAATAAAVAALGVTSLPFHLSSLIALPAVPLMPLKLLQSPALLAQAIHSAVKANTSIASTVNSISPVHKCEAENPLDLTVKHDVPAAKKRKFNSDSELSPPAKLNATSVVVSPKAASPSSTTSVKPSLNNSINGHVKLGKTDRPIYRCESCSIPFYKRDVYEAHKLHYCSQRNGANHAEERTTPKQSVEFPSSTTDDRLVITYTCNKCSTSYRTIETFKAHKCSLVQSPPLEVLTCEECSYSTTSTQIYHEHMETHQKSNLTYKCSLCGYHGSTMRGMKQHGRQHILKGEDFREECDVTVLEVSTNMQQKSPPIPTIRSTNHPRNVEEEMLRIKNEPYKKRRSRKHYQKTDYYTQNKGNRQISPQRKENISQRPSSASSHSNSTHSCPSPLQTSTTIMSEDNLRSPSISPVTVKQEPEEINIALPTQVPLPSLLPDKRPLPLPIKNFMCVCNATFASATTFEAHKKLYCPHKKVNKSNTTIAVTH